MSYCNVAHAVGNRSGNNQQKDSNLDSYFVFVADGSNHVADDDVIRSNDNDNF